MGVGGVSLLPSKEGAARLVRLVRLVVCSLVGPAIIGMLAAFKQLSITDRNNGFQISTDSRLDREFNGLDVDLDTHLLTRARMP